MANLKVASEAHWHELRSRNIGASEVSALFGASPYISKFTLWHQKAGNVSVPEFGSERMEWGNELEPVIAKVLARRQGWKIRNVQRYITHKEIQGMGASLDYEILDHPDGPGCFEIKNMDYASYKRGWVEDDDGNVEAPMHIELQLQHQMAVTGYKWGAFGYLVNGNDGRVVIRKRHEPTIKKLEAAIPEFWKSIAEGSIPPVEDAGDLVALTELFTGAATVKVDDENFETLAAHLLDAQAVEKTSKEAVKLLKAKIIDFINTNSAEIAIGTGFTASYKEQTRASYVAKASTFRVLRVSETNRKGK